MIPEGWERGVQARDLIERLTQVLDDRMLESGHPAALVQNEHLGTCSVHGCSDRCVSYRALFVEAVAWLDEHPAVTVEQLALLEAT